MLYINLLYVFHIPHTSVFSKRDLLASWLMHKVFFYWWKVTHCLTLWKPIDWRWQWQETGNVMFFCSSWFYCKLYAWCKQFCLKILKCPINLLRHSNHSFLPSTSCLKVNGFNGGFYCVSILNFCGWCGD